MITLIVNGQSFDWNAAGAFATVASLDFTSFKLQGNLGNEEWSNLRLAMSKCSFATRYDGCNEAGTSRQGEAFELEIQCSAQHSKIVALRLWNLAVWAKVTGTSFRLVSSSPFKQETFELLTQTLKAPALVRVPRVNTPRNQSAAESLFEDVLDQARDIAEARLSEALGTEDDDVEPSDSQ